VRITIAFYTFWNGAVLTGEQVECPAVLLADGCLGTEDGLRLLGGLEADVTFAVPFQYVHVDHRRHLGEGVLHKHTHRAWAMDPFHTAGTTQVSLITGSHVGLTMMGPLDLGQRWCCDRHQ